MTKLEFVDMRAFSGGGATAQADQGSVVIVGNSKVVHRGNSWDQNSNQSSTKRSSKKS